MLLDFGDRDKNGDGIISDDERLTAEQRNAQSVFLQALIAGLGNLTGAEGEALSAAVASAQAEADNNTQLVHYEGRPVLICGNSPDDPCSGQTIDPTHADQLPEMNKAHQMFDEIADKLGYNSGDLTDEQRQMIGDILVIAVTTGTDVDYLTENYAGIAYLKSGNADLSYEQVLALYQKGQEEYLHRVNTVIPEAQRMAWMALNVHGPDSQEYAVAVWNLNRVSTPLAMDAFYGSPSGSFDAGQAVLGYRRDQFAAASLAAQNAETAKLFCAVYCTGIGGAGIAVAAPAIGGALAGGTFLEGTATFAAGSTLGVGLNEVQGEILYGDVTWGSRVGAALTGGIGVMRFNYLASLSPTAQGAVTGGVSGATGNFVGQVVDTTTGAQIGNIDVSALGIQTVIGTGTGAVIGSRQYLPPPRSTYFTPRYSGYNGAITGPRGGTYMPASNSNGIQTYTNSGKYFIFENDVKIQIPSPNNSSGNSKATGNGSASSKDGDASPQMKN